MRSDALERVCFEICLRLAYRGKNMQSFYFVGCNNADYFLIHYTFLWAFLTFWHSLRILQWLAKLIQQRLSVPMRRNVTSDLLLQPCGSENWSGWSPGESLHVEGAAIRRSRGPGRKLLTGESVRPPLSCLPDVGKHHFETIQQKFLQKSLKSF